MIVYKYDIETKEYIQELEINEAYGTSLPFTTSIKPLTKKDGFVVCFNGTKWEYIEDNRNIVVYNKETKEESKIDYLGKIKDTDTLLIPGQFDKWEVDKWVEDTVKAEEYRISSIKSKAQSLILSKYSLEKQSSAQLGLYGEVYLQEMKDYISNIIRISNEAELNGTKVEEDIQWL